MSVSHFEYPIPIDDLTRKLYTFYVDGETLYLDTYSEQTRKTKRSGWNTGKFFSRLSGRDSNMMESEIELDERLRKDVLAAYLKELTAKLVVLKWSERFSN